MKNKCISDTLESGHIKTSTPDKVIMILYHYTDQNGFMGIFDKKILWATKIQYLNDSTEYYLAGMISSKIIKKKIEIEKDIDIKVMYDEFLASNQLDLNVNYCVCSLSEQGDLLSQWRGYSKKMGGYSIGFDFEMIKSIAEENGFSLIKCVYDEQEQYNMVELIINEAVELFSKSNKSTRESVGYFRDALVKLSPMLKDKSFSEECEWRLVSVANTLDLDFRAGNSMLVPYKNLPLGSKDSLRKALKKIIVGHTPNAALAIASTNSFLVKTLLSKKDYPLKFGMFDIRASSIPYRTW